MYFRGVCIGVVGFLLYFLYKYYQESTQGKQITNFNKTNVSNEYSKLALDYLNEKLEIIENCISTEENKYNDCLDTFKQQFEDAWKKGPSKVTIGNRAKNSYDWSTTTKENYQENLINYFVYAFGVDCEIRIKPMKELIEENIITIKCIHNPKEACGKYRYDNAKELTVSNNEEVDKSARIVKDFICFDKNNYDEEQVLQELELVKEEIILPLLQDKKGQIPAYIMGASGLGLVLLSVFYKKIFSLK